MNTKFALGIAFASLVGCATPARPPQEPALRGLPPHDVTFRADVNDLGTERETRRFEIDPAILGKSPEFLNALQMHVAPGAWGPRFDCAMYVEDGKLVVRHDPVILRDIDTALEALRAHPDRLVHVQARIVTLPADRLPFDRLQGGDGFLYGVFDRETATRAVVRSSEISVITMPRLSIDHGRMGQVTMSNQFAYISSVEPAGEAAQGDPVISVLTEGLHLELGAIANGDARDQFVVSIKLDLADRPSLVTIRGDLGICQLPVMPASRIGGRFAVGRDQSLVIVRAHPNTTPAAPRLMAFLIDVGWAN